jgi:hypothetical protein
MIRASGWVGFFDGVRFGLYLHREPFFNAVFLESSMVLHLRLISL